MGSDLQSDVYGSGLVHRQNEFSYALGSETRSPRFQSVSAGAKIEKDVVAGVIGYGLVLHSGVDIVQCDRGVGDHCDSSFSNDTRDMTRRELVPASIS